MLTFNFHGTPIHAFIHLFIQYALSAEYETVLSTKPTAVNKAGQTLLSHFTDEITEAYRS